MVCVNVIRKTASIAETIRFNPQRSFLRGKSELEKGFEDVFVSSGQTPVREAQPFLDAVSRAVPFEKPKRFQIAENLHNMILDVTKATSDATGKDAVVFPIPNHDDLVLRVEKTALAKMDKLPEKLELVPISYPSGIAENPHLGLPLYYVTSSGETAARKISMSPMEALAQANKMMVLKRVKGVHPSSEVGEKFFDMIGFSDFKNPDPDAFNNYSFIFGFARNEYGGNKAVEKCLEYCKNGADIIPAGAICEGSEAFELVRGKEFYAKYKAFAESYIDSLKSISEFPQESYNDAVKFIVQDKNFNVDFQHTNNTFVDLEKKEFNFMDFAFDKKDEKYIYDNPVKEFRNVLLGKGFQKLSEFSVFTEYVPRCLYPYQLLAGKDYEAANKYASDITKKVKIAIPRKEG